MESQVDDNVILLQAYFESQKIEQNAILDSEERYCKIDLLQYVNDKHLMKRLAVDVAKATFLPVNTVFLVGLGVFSSMACRRYCVEYPDGTLLPVGLYVVSEQPPGTGKSRCIKFFQKPFIDAVYESRAKMALEFKSYESRLKRSVNMTDSEIERGEQLQDDLRRLSVISFLTNCTPEGLEKTLGDSGGFLSGVSSEQGLFNTLMGATYGSGRDTGVHNNDIVLNAFDGGVINSIRASRAGYSGHVVGGIAGFAQDGTIQRIMASSNGIGLAERFLMLAEGHNLGKRDHKLRHAVSIDLLQEYAVACSFVDHIIKELPDFKKLSKLSITRESFDSIADYQNSIEPNLVDGGEYSHSILRGAAGKVDMQIMKIAANLHLTTGGGSISDQIPDYVISTAIKICNDLITANAQIGDMKGFTGKRSAFQAVLSLYERDSKPKTSRMIKHLMHKVKPFSEYTGSASKLIQETLGEMVVRGVLVSTKDGRKLMYSLNQ